METAEYKGKTIYIVKRLNESTKVIVTYNKNETKKFLIDESEIKQIKK